MTDADRLAGRRLRSAFDLYAAALDIQRVNLRRRHPEATEAELEQRLHAWLLDRPGAPLGDGDGVPTTRALVDG